MSKLRTLPLKSLKAFHPKQNRQHSVQWNYSGAVSSIKLSRLRLKKIQQKDINMADKEVVFTDSTTFNEKDMESQGRDSVAAFEETPLLPKSGKAERNTSILSDATFDVDEIENRMSDLTDEQEESNCGQADVDPTFHLGNQRVSAMNVHVSPRRTPSFDDFGDVYEQVPTQLKKNRKLVIDSNLYLKEKGKLYLAQYSFYKNRNETKYAMTIQSDIYAQILNEVNSAHTVPCGLYFCCHGGDGAHTGVSHDDFVDIKLAWIIVIFVFAILLTIEITVPWPEDDGVIGDDIFSAATP